MMQNFKTQYFHVAEAKRVEAIGHLAAQRLELTGPQNGEGRITASAG